MKPKSSRLKTPPKSASKVTDRPRAPTVPPNPAANRYGVTENSHSGAAAGDELAGAEFGSWSEGVSVICFEESIRLTGGRPSGAVEGAAVCSSLRLMLKAGL